MLLRIQSVNFNELHDRETFVVVSTDADDNVRINYAMLVNRRKENAARTQYVCYYFGLNSAEFSALRQLPDEVMESFTFLGIPNDTIDVNHEVTSLILEPKPVAYLGVDRPTYLYEEFEGFIKVALEVKGIVTCKKNVQSSSSWKTSLESLTAIKESFVASQGQQG